MDWRHLSAAGIALFAGAALLPREAASVRLTAPDGSGVLLVVQKIVCLEEGPLVGPDGVPGSTIRTMEGQEVRVVEPPSSVLAAAGELVPLRSARPAYRAGTCLVHVRASAIAAVRPSPFRVVGSDRRDTEISLLGGWRVLVREEIETVRGMIR